MSNNLSYKAHTHTHTHTPLQTHAQSEQNFITIFAAAANWQRVRQQGAGIEAK